jgi:hypothetical protein
VAVQLRYQPAQLLVTVSDDGLGDPGELRRLPCPARGAPADGRHRGLANIESRLTELGGAVAFRRSRLGGVRVELRLPLPLSTSGRPATISGLVGVPADLPDPDVDADPAPGVPPTPHEEVS